MSTRQVRLPAELLDRVNDQLPKHIPLHSFCAILLEQALDKGFTLIAPSESREPESTLSEGAISNVLSTKESTSTESSLTVRKRKQTQGSDEFNAFWKLYQSCPLKAVNQRKNKAWEEWVKAIKIETPERLTEALENAMAAQRKAQADEGWAPMLPDCFRWLKDGCYTAALETHEVANPLLIKYNTDPEYRAWCERELASDPNFVLPHLRKK